MAIKKLNLGDNTSTNLTLLYDFLNENKSSTFLSAMTISYDGTDGAPLTITSANGTTLFRLQLLPKLNINYNRELCRYSTNGIDWISNCYAGNNNYSSSCWLKAALLCTNGLIFHFRGNYCISGNPIYESVGIALTIDSHNELGYLRNNQYIPASSSFITTTGEWLSISSDSTTYQMTVSKTAYGANRTCLSPISTNGSDPDSCLPYAYAALSSQLAGEGLSAVRINGVDYITNGCWYIRDTPEE